MTATFPLSHIKSHLSEIVDQIERQHDRVVLTRNGVPAAVLVSPDDLQALEDTLELLSDPQALAEIEIARTQIAEGRFVSAEDLHTKYLSK